MTDEGKAWAGPGSSASPLQPLERGASSDRQQVNSPPSTPFSGPFGAQMDVGRFLSPT